MAEAKEEEGVAEVAAVEAEVEGEEEEKARHKRYSVWGETFGFVLHIDVLSWKVLSRSLV